MMPIMGRRKYKVAGKQRGRNEIFRVYMEISFASLVGDPTEAIRKRKQVSSHMQVVKAWFKESRACKQTTSRSRRRRRPVCG
jgi:transcriptional enhancer factor